MTYSIYFSIDAEQDLLEIYGYIKESGYPINAKNLLSKLKKACLSLSNNPERGQILKELDRIGVFEFREINIKVYRIIYQVVGSKVIIHCILDGRREIQDILKRRIIRIF